MTEGRLFHTKHALGFGREPEQEVASMSACIARSQRTPHRPCTTVLTPVVIITGFTFFYEGFTPFPPPVFTGFKFSLIKTPLITGVKIPIITLNHPRQGVGAARNEARTRPERHAYKYPMGVGKMTEGRLFHTTLLDSGGNRSREVASMSACIARSQRTPHRPCTTVLTPVVVITGFTFL